MSEPIKDFERRCDAITRTVTTILATAGFLYIIIAIVTSTLKP